MNNIDSYVSNFSKDFDNKDLFLENLYDCQKKLREIVSLFPKKSGVYRMYDQKKNICYIGKAKNLRHRVLSYFNFSEKRAITHVLLSKVVFIDYLVTETESEALILENNLIKLHQPFFNINLKDNKTYPYLLLTEENGYLRLVKTRLLNAAKFSKKKEIYFGPYTNVLLMDAYLDAINQIYPLKKCSKQKFPKNFKPCLYFHIEECLDYCTGGVAPETVQKMAREIKDLLRGRQSGIIAKLKERMLQESVQQNFERAMNFRNAIQSLTRINHQQFVSTVEENHFDVLHYITDENFLIIALLQFRLGKLVNKHIFEYSTSLFSQDDPKCGDANQNVSNFFLIEVFSRFLYDYYSRQDEMIGEVLIPPSLFMTDGYDGAVEELKNALFSAMHKKNENSAKKISLPTLLAPQKGTKKRFLKLAEVNAALSLQELIRKNQRADVLKSVKRALFLSRIPKVIECFDIANTGHSHIMAGMTRYVDGQKEKAGYRLFNMTLTMGQDDFLSIKEAVFRRYQRCLYEKNEKTLPDLIVIDGGKGQLSAAKMALKSLHLQNIPIVSLAKKEEFIFISPKDDPIKLPHSDEVLRFLVQIRDETHRFVNSSHIRKRDKQNLRSRLQEIKGFGEKKIKILSTNFSSWEQLQNCTLQQIQQLPFFSEKDYHVLKNFFKNAKNDNSLYY